jgi:hypothetical protein
MTASAVLLMALQWDLTFFQDSWAFLLERRDFSTDSFLRPHNEHLVLLQVGVTQLCLGLFGMTSALPEAAVMTMSLLGSALLLFVYVRRRTSPWLALMAATLVLFLGSAWMILLWPFEIEFSGAMVAGLGMLLMLERGDSRGDAWACLLLAVSIGFGSLGLSFAVAAFVDVVQRRRFRGLGRSYVFAVPLLLYLLWYAGWGHTAADHLTLDNVLDSPRYVLDGLASSLASLLGLSTAAGATPAPPEWGRPLLFLALAAAIFGKWLRPGISPRLWPVAAATATYWALAAFNFIPGREAASNRYVYAGGIFILLMAADLLRGVPIGRRALSVAGAVTVLALGTNLAQMREGHDVLKEQTLLARADTAALEIARRTVPPEMPMLPEITGTLANVAIVPGPYLEAVDAHGSPAYSTAELAAAPANGRHWADILLSKALPLSLVIRPRAAVRAGDERCLASGADAEVPDVRVGPGITTIHLAAGPPAVLRARRFATDELPVELGTVPGGASAVVRIPRDGAPSYPWYLKLESGQPSRICP